MPVVDGESLYDDLLAIDGVGEATAEKVLEAVEDNAAEDVVAAADLDGVVAALEDAVDSHEAGRHEYASKFTRRAHRALSGD